MELESQLRHFHYTSTLSAISPSVCCPHKSLQQSVKLDLVFWAAPAEL